MERLRALLGRNIIRNFLKLFTSTVFAQGLSFVLSPLFSRMYTPEEFGLIGLYMSIVSVLSVVSTGKYEQAIMLPAENKNAMTLFWLVQLITGVVAAVTLLLVLLFNPWITSLLGNPGIGPWLYWLPLSLVLHGLLQGATYYANRHKLFGMMAGGTITQYSVLNGVRLGMGLLQAPVNGLIAAQLAAQLAGAAYMIRKIWARLMEGLRALTWQSIRQQAAEYSGYPRYNMPLNFSNNLSGSLPILMFTWGFGLETAGWYTFGYTFVFRPLSLFSLSAMQVFSQKIIEDHHQGHPIYPQVTKMVKRFFWLGLLPFVLLAWLGPWLFEGIFSEEYALSGKILQILTPWLFVVFLTSPLSFLPELFFRQKKAMIIDLVYLVLRFFALATGIYFKNLWLAVWLFSGVSTLVVLYNLWWYIKISRLAD